MVPWISTCLRAAHGCEPGVVGGVSAVAGPCEGMGLPAGEDQISGESGCHRPDMAERPDGSMQIEDCEAISRALRSVSMSRFRSTRPIAGDFLAGFDGAGATCRLRALCRPLVTIEMAVAHQGRKRISRARWAASRACGASASRDDTRGEEPDVRHW